MTLSAGIQTHKTNNTRKHLHVLYDHHACSQIMEFNITFLSNHVLGMSPPYTAPFG